MAVARPLQDVRQRHRTPTAKWIALAAELASLAVIVAAAAYTRLWYLNLVMFGDDEAAISQLAVAFVEGKGFPLIGNHASVGINNPPMFVYLMAIPYAFTRDPALATGFIGFLGVVAVVGCYFLTRAHFGVKAAMIASLLFAVHPWAVIYARKIWEPDVMPLFAVLFVASLLAYLDNGRVWRLVLTFLCLAIAIEVHFSGVVLLLVLVVAIVAYRDRFRWHHLLASAAVAAATTAPYLFWQAQHSWVDFSRAREFASSPPQWDNTAVWLLYTMVASPGYVARDESATFDLVYRIEGGVFAAGLVYALYHVIRRLHGVSPQQRRALGIFLLWVLAPVLLFTRHLNGIPRHYFVVVFPAEFIIIGVLVTGIFRVVVDVAAARLSVASVRQLSAIGAALIVILVLSIASPQLYDFTAFYRLQWLGQTPQRMIVHDIFNNGAPVGYTRDLYREIASLNSAHPEQPVYQQVPILQDLIVPRFLANGPVPAKWLGSGASSTLVLPPPGTADALFVTAKVDGQAAKLLQSLDSTSRIVTMTYPQSDMKVAFYRLSADTRGRALQALDLQPLPYALGNGVRFLGYSLPRRVQRGAVVELVTAWEVGNPEIPRREYQFYAHLVDSTLRPWDKVDSLDYNASQWSPSETVISWHEIPVGPDAPPGLYHVLIGMYDHVGTLPVPVIGPQGRLADSGLRLGPIKVTAGSDLLTSLDAVVQHRQVAHLADKVTLLGYDLPDSVMRPGDDLALTLHWVAGAPRPDYTVFVHLVDGSGRLVAQVDSQPRMGKYPTSVWDEGEYVRDDYRLPLPKSLPPASYRLVIGMYQLETGQRLPMTNELGQPAGDSIELDSAIDVR